MQSNINFVDLRAQHEEVRPQIEAAITDIINRSSFIGGNYVATFEREFAEFLGASDVVACGNGTDALWLALYAAGVRAGHLVVTTPNTFIATTEAITRLGAIPLFVDCDLPTASLGVSAVQALLEGECRRQDDGSVLHLKTGRILSALLPVHLYGLPVDMTGLMALAQAWGLPVIEDACQAHGARVMYNGEWKRAGTIGLAAGFSFYPGKNLGAMGDGGAVAVNDANLAAQMRSLRDHGSSEKYVHMTPDGWNSRLDSLQAAVLAIKLKKLDEWNGRRRRAAAGYREALSNLPLELPVEPAYAEHIYHLYVVRAADRETLRKELSARGVGVGLHYPIPLHLQKAYANLGYPQGSFPNSEAWAFNGLSLPMHQALTEAQIAQVAEAVHAILKG